MARLVPVEYTKGQSDSRLWPSVFEGSKEECEVEIKRIRDAKIKEYTDTVERFRKFAPDVSELQITAILGINMPLQAGYFIVD